MLYRIAADAVVLLHLAFVLFVLLGGLLALRFRRAPWVHLPAAVWGAWVELSGRVCPLTPLENWLRQRGGEAGYDGGFVEHHVLPVLYPSALTREVQILLAAVVLVANVLIYTWVIRRWWGRRAGGPPAGG